MKFGLEQKAIERIAAVFASYPQIKKVILYGSRAMGNYKKGSDIDLSLVAEELDPNLANAVALELDDLMLPYSIDLSIFSKIQNPDLRDHIKRRGIVFYESKGTSADSAL